MAYSRSFAEALTYAAHLHGNQVRKGSGIPYVTHLMSVAGIVAEYGGDEEQVIAALLHDAVEDQGGRPRLDEIRMRFGEEVAALVAACTDSFDQPKPPWRPRKEAYLAHLRTAPERVLLISAADKLHNGRSIVRELQIRGPAHAFAHFKGGRDGTLWYYRELVRIFRERGPAFLNDELASVVSEMERLSDDTVPGE